MTIDNKFFLDIYSDNETNRCDCWPCHLKTTSMPDWRRLYKENCPPDQLGVVANTHPSHMLPRLERLIWFTVRRKKKRRHVIDQFNVFFPAFSPGTLAILIANCSSRTSFSMGRTQLMCWRMAQWTRH